MPEMASMVEGMDINKETSQAVQRAIELSGMTQLFISAQTNIPRTTLQRRLSGETSWTLAEIDSIAKLLNMKPAELVPHRFSGKAVA